MAAAQTASLEEKKKNFYILMVKKISRILVHPLHSSAEEAVCHGHLLENQIVKWLHTLEVSLSKCDACTAK